MAMLDNIEVEELVVNEGDGVTLNCLPSDMASIFINNVTTNMATFQSENVSRDNTGFYQCLISTMGSMDSLYLLVACEYYEWLVDIYWSLHFREFYYVLLLRSAISFGKGSAFLIGLLLVSDA